MGMDISFTLVNKKYCTPTQLKIFNENNIISKSKISKEYSIEIAQSIDYVLYENFSFEGIHSKEECYKVYDILEEYFKDNFPDINYGIYYFKMNEVLINKIYDSLKEDLPYLFEDLKSFLNEDYFIFCYISN